jgi:hypothetical protein
VLAHCRSVATACSQPSPWARQHAVRVVPLPRRCSKQPGPAVAIVLPRPASVGDVHRERRVGRVRGGRPQPAQHRRARLLTFRRRGSSAAPPGRRTPPIGKRRGPRAWLRSAPGSPRSTFRTSSGPRSPACRGRRRPAPRRGSRLRRCRNPRTGPSRGRPTRLLPACPLAGLLVAAHAGTVRPSRRRSAAWSLGRSERLARQEPVVEAAVARSPHRESGRAGSGRSRSRGPQDGSVPVRHGLGRRSLRRPGQRVGAREDVRAGRERRAGPAAACCSWFPTSRPFGRQRR